MKLFKQELSISFPLPHDFVDREVGGWTCELKSLQGRELYPGFTRDE